MGEKLTTRTQPQPQPQPQPKPEPEPEPKSLEPHPHRNMLPTAPHPDAMQTPVPAPPTTTTPPPPPNVHHTSLVSRGQGKSTGRYIVVVWHTVGWGWTAHTGGCDNGKIPPDYETKGGHYPRLPASEAAREVDTQQYLASKQRGSNGYTVYIPADAAPLAPVPIPTPTTHLSATHW